ncbi:MULTISPECIES: helix-turn-helix transcriptional regulator [Henriciella]|jgi:predicted DNA-binding transcriptional regulator AlpA|uniref:helix-turn-helix transcriptional regulator n=1 Tax=Henriciella TaxID=453849 RepID=UPI0035136317
MNIENYLREFVRAEVTAQLEQRLDPRPEEYLTTKQVAELTGLSISYFQVARSMGSEDQPPYSRHGRRVVYRRSDVDRWMQERG